MIVDTIITDMDDTLFNEEGKLSQFTLNVMQECLRRNIRVIPASGRAQASMQPYIDLLATKLPYIASNGAQLVAADHSLLEEYSLSAETARQVCKALEEHGCYVQAYRGKVFYYAKECDPSIAYKKSSGMKGKAVGDLQAFLTFDTPKLLAVHHPDIIATLHPKMTDCFGNQVSFTISKPYFLEAAPSGVNKGMMLHRLAKRMGFAPQNTWVFGDSLNDISMFSFTKNSVAMGNARDEVKKIAKYICGPNNQDGMARFVSEHLLQ